VQRIGQMALIVSRKLAIPMTQPNKRLPFVNRREGFVSPMTRSAVGANDARAMGDALLSATVDLLAVLLSFPGRSCALYCLITPWWAWICPNIGFVS
jgi:hypothetical protein